MKLIKASEQDSEKIKGFYNEQIMSGTFDYKTVRNNSFFDQYRLLTEDYSTYLLTDEDQEIQAMASVLFRRGYLNSQEQTVGYVTDLRVAPSRTAILQWAQRFMPALRREMDERQCKYLFSTLEQFESQAYNALMRRKNRKTHLPRYFLFRKFFLVAILGRSPFAEAPVRSIQIRRGQESDIEAVSEYLMNKAISRPLYFHVSPEEIQRRCENWPLFSMNNFLIARNSKGDIIGCVAPWNNKEVQQWVLQDYHGKSQRVFQTMKPLSFLRIGKKLPSKEQAFNTLFLTHQGYDNPDIFYALLNQAYNESQRDEVIVYNNYIGEYQSRPSRSFLNIKVPYGFYSLLAGNELLPSFLHPNPFLPAPDFNYVHV